MAGAHSTAASGFFFPWIYIYVSLGMELELELELETGMGFHSFPLFSFGQWYPGGSVVG